MLHYALCSVWGFLLFALRLLRKTPSERKKARSFMHKWRTNPHSIGGGLRIVGTIPTSTRSNAGATTAQYTHTHTSQQYYHAAVTAPAGGGAALAVLLFLPRSIAVAGCHPRPKFGSGSGRFGSLRFGSLRFGSMSLSVAGLHSHAGSVSLLNTGQPTLSNPRFSSKTRLADGETVKMHLVTVSSALPWSTRH